MQKIPTISYYRINEKFDELRSFRVPKKRKIELLQDLKILYEELSFAKKLELDNMQYSIAEKMIKRIPYSLCDRFPKIYKEKEVYDLHKDNELLLFALYSINIPQHIIARIFHVSQSTISKLITKNYESTLSEKIVNITMT